MPKEPTLIPAGADHGQLPNLATFAHAAELSSFTAAAKALRLTQAAVSQRMQALEKIVGKSLFQRKGGRVLLTDAGRKLYGYAQRILELHREAQQAIAGREAPVAGELLIAASSIPGEHLLPALLADFHKQHPQLRVHATIRDSMAVMAQVERGEVSLGLVGRKSDNPHLEFRRCANDQMVLVVPPDHVLSKRRKIAAQQLTKHPLILREVGSGLRYSFEQALKRAGLSLADYQIALELGSNEAVKEAVKRGVGVAILSRYAVELDLKARQLRAVPVSDLSLDREMFLVLDRRRVLPLPARMFLLFLETHPIATQAP